MNRIEHFLKAVARPVTIKDARFGLRKFSKSKNETQDIFSYSSPGIGPNGEHQT